MKKLIFTLILTLCSIASWADEDDVYTIDGICYTLQADREAIVHYGYYSGDIVIPDSIVYDNKTYAVVGIEEFSFYNLPEVTSIVVPNTVKTIGHCAFSGCCSLTSIKLSESLEVIEYSIFNDCCSLKSLVIPNSVKKINEAFWNCYALESITIGSSVEEIDQYAFRNTDLTTISIDENNQKYDSRDNCNAIIETASNTLIHGFKTTTIPNTVTSIGEHAFEMCKLTSITIPESVTSIGNYAFYECVALESVSMPNSLTSIGYHAFDNTGLTSVTIPNSVTSIGADAFCVCASLTSVTLPESLTTLESEVFLCCNKLASIVIPESVTSIGYGAFYSTALTSITIPESVTSIGDYAFFLCSELSSVTNLAETPQSIRESVFDYYYTDLSTIDLYVPQGSVDAYKAADVWKEFNIIGIDPAGIENLNDGSTSSPQVKTTKHIEDGQVVIIRPEGSKYTLSGQRME